MARRAQFLLPTIALIVVLSGPVAAQKKLTASEAKDHIGETATVCGSVVSSRYAVSTKGDLIASADNFEEAERRLDVVVRFHTTHVYYQACGVTGQRADPYGHLGPR